MSDANIIVDEATALTSRLSKSRCGLVRAYAKR